MIATQDRLAEVQPDGTINYTKFLERYRVQVTVAGGRGEGGDAVLTDDVIGGFITSGRKLNDETSTNRCAFDVVLSMSKNGGPISAATGKRAGA